MPINSRAKGAVGERELVQEFLRNGILAERTVQYCGRGGDADLRLFGTTMHCEVKRTEKLRLSDAVAQATRDARSNPWVIIHRASRSPWLVIQTFDQWCRDSHELEVARAARRAVVQQSASPNA